MSNAIEPLVTDGSMSADANADQFLTFILAGEEYGVDILRVQEIRGWTSATVIPNVPEYVRGVINLRGTIVPIIDLRRRFGMTDAAYGATTVVIVLKVLGTNGDRVMGIVVDAVSDVYNIDRQAIKSPPDFGGKLSVDFIRGLATVNDKMVIVLDIDRLMNNADIDAGVLPVSSEQEKVA